LTDLYGGFERMPIEASRPIFKATPHEPHLSTAPVKTPQNTARTTRKVGICRGFMGLILPPVIDRQCTITDRPRKYRPLIDRTVIRAFADLSP
jgi:hypothetical protein